MLQPHGRSPSDLATQALSQRVRTLFKFMPRALSGHEESVHQLRVAGRRLRVALPLLATRPDGRRVRRARHGLRDLVRTAGLTRDLDVGLELFETLLPDPPSPEARRLRGLLRGARTRGRARLVRAFLDEDLPGLRRDLRTLVGRADEFVHALQRTRSALVELGWRTRADLVALQGRYEPIQLHALRRRVRKLRYVTETAEALGMTSNEAVRAFKRQQQLLGVIQDGHVLAERLASMAARSEAGRRTAMSGEAAHLAALLRERSRSAHRAWLQSEPLAQLDATLAMLAGRNPLLEPRRSVRIAAARG
jgi:CHAD domain-containing protein